MGSYDLWDTETGNRIGTYRCEWAARLDAADAARRYGEDRPVVRAPGRDDATARSTPAAA